MSKRLPVHIDPLQLAGKGELLSGDLELAGMRRLAPSLHTTEGAVEVTLEFGVDPERIPYLQGHIRGKLILTCQRCMQAVDFPVDLDMTLGLVNSPAEADALPDHYEPLMAGSEPVILPDVIEDELLLCLPLVPKHPESQCPASAQKREEKPQDTRKPFAVLSDWKKNG
ncbi:MAG: DUF177 domain-containing protein [Gammaproteobacteria bacterium]|nr:DUF177 domain-containing protein [Gammaproteobacteria bacterium]